MKHILPVFCVIFLLKVNLYAQKKITTAEPATETQAKASADVKRILNIDYLVAFSSDFGFFNKLM